MVGGVLSKPPLPTRSPTQPLVSPPRKPAMDQVPLLLTSYTIISSGPPPLIVLLLPHDNLSSFASSFPFLCCFLLLFLLSFINIIHRSWTASTGVHQGECARRCGQGCRVAEVPHRHHHFHEDAQCRYDSGRGGEERKGKRRG